MATPADQAMIDPRRVLGLFALVGGIAILARVDRPSPRLSFPPLTVDLNTAPREVLAALPNLGPARVAAIEAAREIEPFRSADDLDRRVKGIGPATVGELAPYLRFDVRPEPIP